METTDGEFAILLEKQRFLKDPRVYLDEARKLGLMLGKPATEILEFCDRLAKDVRENPLPVMVHGLYAAQPLCTFSSEAPVQWASNQKMEPYYNVDLITCSVCKARARDMNRRAGPGKGDRDVFPDDKP